MSFAKRFRTIGGFLSTPETGESSLQQADSGGTVVGIHIQDKPNASGIVRSVSSRIWGSRRNRDRKLSTWEKASAAREAKAYINKLYRLVKNRSDFDHGVSMRCKFEQPSSSSIDP